MLIPTWYFQGIEDLAPVSMFVFVGPALSIPAMYLFVRHRDDVFIAMLVNTLVPLLSGIAICTFLYFRRELDLVPVSLGTAFKRFKEGWSVLTATYRDIAGRHLRIYQHRAADLHRGQCRCGLLCRRRQADSRGTRHVAAVADRRLSARKLSHASRARRYVRVPAQDVRSAGKYRAASMRAARGSFPPVHRTITGPRAKTGNWCWICPRRRWRCRAASSNARARSNSTRP